MTFEELMNFCDSNREVYADLLMRCRNKAVVPLFGAGMSFWAGYPSWDELLCSLCQNDKNLVQQVQGLLREYKYEEAAGVVEVARERQRFRKDIQRSFLSVEVREECRPRYQLRIARIFSGNILTTNYDHLVEELYDGHLQILNPRRVNCQDEVMRLLQSRAGALFKIHGDIDSPAEIVLTEHDYEEVYGKSPSGADADCLMPKCFQNMLANNSILFLGASLTSDRTVQIIKNFAPTVLTHFAVMAEPKRVELKNWGIKCIWIPKGSYDESYQTLFDRLALDLGLDEFSNDGFMPVRDLIGREDTVDEAIAYWRSQSNSVAPFLWVSGPGGIGKTEVCKQVCRKISEQEGRRVFVSLRGIHTVAAVYESVVRASGYDAQGMLKDELERRAFSLLKSKASSGVVYFDNAEDLLNAFQDDVAEKNEFYGLIRRLRESRVGVVLSSRTGLPDGSLGKEISLSGLAEPATAELFNAVWGRGAEASEEEAFRELLRRLSGYPLAIVLAAQQARALDGIDFNLWLKAESNTCGGDVCHSSLTMALSSTWNFVHQNSQAVAIWGLFHESCVPLSKQIMRSMLGTERIEQGLTVLRRYGLVSRDVNDCYDMLNPLREAYVLFASKELVVKARKSWVGYFESLLQKADSTSVPKNLRPIVPDEKTHQELMEMLPQLWHLMRTLCLCQWTKSLARLVDRARNQFQFDVSSLSLLELLESYFAGQEGRQNELSLAYQYSGDLQKHLGLYEAALTSYDKALAILMSLSCLSWVKDVNRWIGIANIYRSQGDLFRQLGRPDAERLFNDARTIYRRYHDKVGEANAIAGLGDILEQQGDVERALEFYYEAQHIYSDVQDYLGLANVMLGISDIEGERGHWERAEEFCRTSHDLYGKMSLVHGQGNAMCTLGNIMLRQKRYDEAFNAYQRACDLYDKTNDRQGKGNAFLGMAQVRLKEQNFHECDRLAVEAGKLYNELNSRVLQATLKEFRGDQCRAVGDVTTAYAAYKEAYKIFDSLRGVRDCSRISAILSNIEQGKFDIM